jgi:hypothetical protein
MLGRDLPTTGVGRVASYTSVVQLSPIYDFARKNIRRKMTSFIWPPGGQGLTVGKR